MPNGISYFFIFADENAGSADEKRFNLSIAKQNSLLT